MSVTTTVKKVVTDQTYATVGATDLAVETFRGYTSQIAALGAELEPKKVQARVKAAPTDAQNYYAGLTKRGEDLIARIRKQQATQDLVGQAEATVALGKGAITTVRKAVADSVDVDVKVDTDKAKKAVSGSAKRTTTAAKRTSTTTKKAATRTRTATKSTATAAKKTAAKTTKAADKAADKVGD